MAWTGFIGIDAEALGDGDDDTQTLDAYLAQRISLSTDVAGSGREAICFSPVVSNASDFTTFAGIRPYAQTEAGSVWKGFIVVNKKQTGITVGIAYQSEAVGKSGSPAGYNRAILKLVNDEGVVIQKKSASLGDTYDTGTKTGYFEFSFDFDSPATRAHVLGFVFEVEAVISQSALATAHGSGSDGSTSAIDYIMPFKVRDTTDGTSANEFWMQNSAAPGPTLDSFECMYFVDDNAPTDTMDILCTYDGGTDGTYAWMVQGIPNAPGSTNAAHTRASQSFFLRALTIRPEFDRGFGWNSGNIIYNLGPHQEVGASEHLQQAEHVRELYQKWRPVLVGPAGMKNSSATNLNMYDHYDYAVHWPLVYGDYDGTTAGQETVIIDSSFYLNTPNPDLELRCIFLAAQYGVGLRLYRHEQGSEAFSRWDISIAVQQIADKASGGATWAADATSYASLDTTERIKTWGSSVFSDQSPDAPPVLRGIDADEAGGKTPSTGASFWFKEGTLFADRGDADYLLTTKAWDLPVTGMTSANLAMPFRLKVSATLDEYDSPISSNFTSAALLNASLKLMLVGFVLVEKPNV